MSTDRISASQAARLFLGAQGLLEDPARRATLPELRRLIERLGFVQLDSINVVERAHHLTLAARLDGYVPEQLARLLEQERFLFEHWTHDASAIPLRWYAQWKPRFKADAARFRGHAWWQYHLGAEGDRVVAHVRARIAAEGPLQSSDFEHLRDKKAEWWGWKPQKAALDYLWRVGELAVAGRVSGFQKLYDLSERVHPEPHASPEPSDAEHLEWACASAAERLVCFTPKELADYWDVLEIAQAKAWCREAAREGRIVPVEVEAADGSAPQPAFALADWEARVQALPEAPARTRLLAPFDPVLRDRARAQRRFNFDYRFEAFTPEAKRLYGYYVLPILEGERFAGRADLKLHRERGLLEVRGLWWERGLRATKARTKALDEALARLTTFVGASEFSV